MTDQTGQQQVEMSAQETWEQRHDVQLLDVREPWEWVAGHVAGAVHVPMQEIPARQDELDADRPIVTICRSGARSDAVASALRGAGYDARNLVGGMHAWAAADLPYVAQDGGVPRVA